VEHGLLPATIWDDPANSDLRKRRKNPNALLAGDVLVIPDLRSRQEQAATEKRHSFRRKAVPDQLSLVLRDEEGKPRKDLPYTAVIDGRSRDGKTDGNGALKVPIPANARSGRLLLGADRAEVHELWLGAIDPIETLSGARQRLANLGYDVDDGDGEPDPTTEEALRAFQADQGLEATGKYDQATRDKLEQAYGS
jgi:N-acetylmuramoyl-L-alanine amidase